MARLRQVCLDVRGPPAYVPSCAAETGRITKVPEWR